MATAYWAGGASGAETDTNNAANWVDAANGTNAFGSVPDGNDDVIIQSTSNSNVSHNPTQTAAHTFNSILIESGGHWTADGSNHLTLDGENSSHFAFRNLGTYTHSNGTVVVNNGGSMSHAALQNGVATSTTGFYDLTITGGGTTCEIFGETTIHRNMEAGGSTTVLRGALTVNGNLTIEGTLNTQYSSTDRNLTVAGGIKSTGTLTANSSTIIITGEIAGFAFDQMGTFNAGTSTLQIGDGSTSTVGSSTHFKSNNCHNLIINQHQDAPNGNVLWRAYTGTEVTIGGNLTVTRGKFIRNTFTLDLTVTGDVDVASVGQLGREEETGSNTFGSLSVASGGTYVATSGTTTITTGGTIGGTSDTAFGGEGTFTHNNGTLVLDSVLHRIPRGGTFYNLKLTGSHNTGGVYLFSDTMLPQAVMPDGTTHAHYFAVLGTLEITNDEFRPYNADKLFVNNLIIGDGTGASGSAKLDMSEADQFDGKMFVNNVTIHSDGKFMFGNNDETSATEGSSALNIYGSFRNLGGQVTLE